jgi:hypothetical protein
MLELVSRKKHEFATRRKRRSINHFKEAESFLSESEKIYIDGLLFRAFRQLRYIHIAAKNILIHIDREEHKKALAKAHRFKELKREQDEIARIDKILAPYVKAWLGKRGRPIVGGMGLRKIVKLSLREPYKIFVHYADKCFHQVVRWDLMRQLPEISDMIIEDKRYEKAITSKP